MPALLLAVLAAALAGATALSAIWGIVAMISEPSAGGVAWICAAWVGAALLAAASSWLAHAAEATFEARLRRTVAGRVLRLPAERLSDYPADRLRRLVSDDIAALHHMIAHLPSEIAALVVVPAAAIVLLLTLAGPVALLALIPGVLAGGVYLAVLPPLSARHGAERGRVMNEITTAVDDYARGIHVFRSFGNDSGALATYTSATERFTAGMVAWVRRVATPAAVAVALLQAPASFAIAYAVGAANDTATLAAILLLSLALVTPALRLGHGLDFVAAGRAAGDRVGALLSEPALPAGDVVLADVLRAGTVPTETGASIAAHAITVRGNGRAVLSELTLTAPASSITAVTGPSGAGKTTLLRVLAGLRTIDAGSVIVGGTSIAEISEATRADTVLLVPQGVAVLAATIRDNLLLSAPGASDAECASALSRAQLGARLDADAATLSGGERQRVALARAFLSPAPVILLDEPTSALDAANTGRVWAEIEKLAHVEGKTVVVVTHDPELAARSDRHVALASAQLPSESELPALGPPVSGSSSPSSPQHQSEAGTSA